MDDKTTVADLKESVRKFCAEREWDQFHDPKELAIGIITEAAELLEHFRFRSKEEMRAMLEDPSRREQIEDELADVLIFAVRFAQHHGIDVSEAYARKLEKTGRKYPVVKAKGKSGKYTEL